ncbi:post-GPI attachment to proteins factor 4-like [Littorina saxatilis]|uniref:Transmembrane protein n=1 Tax=Littorina saxatilis TaxID=31220 RepID=A0AAN9BGW5_9CAEN
MKTWILVRAGDVSQRLRVLLVGRWLVVAGVSLLSLCVLLLASSRPFSSVYSSLHSTTSLAAMATDLNDQRTDLARDYFSQLTRRTLQELQARSPHDGNASFMLSASEPDNTPTPSTVPTFTIVIITVNRKRPRNTNRSLGYVLQSGAALDSLVKNDPMFLDSRLFVCNVDPHPANHEDAVLLKHYLPYVERYGGSVVPALSRLPVPGSEQLYRDVKLPNTFDRERSDYTFCLQAALAFPSQYYLVFQDDALPHPHFPAVLDLSLAKLTKAQQCLKDQSSSGQFLTGLFQSYPTCLSEHPPYMSHSLPSNPRLISPTPNSTFGYLKFHFPERWQGFALEQQRLLDLLSMGCVGGGVALIIEALVAWRRKAGWEPSRTVLCVGVVLTLVVVLLVGRQTVNELRRVSTSLYRLQSPPDCCIPAMLYPAPVMPQLVTWLADSPGHSKVDLRVSDFFKHHDLPSYSIEPNVVRHVGMVTSLSKADRKPVEEFVLFR